MAGPHRPHHRAGALGNPYGQPGYAEPYPEARYGPDPQSGPFPNVYPGMLPPPVAYPAPKRRKSIWIGLAVLVVVGALTAALLTIRTDESSSSATPFTAPAVQSAIQGYLAALSKGDTETIARNSLCGMYDGIKDRRSDQALARLASDAFRRQFSRADVTSIDTVVMWSSYQAQVLFTMRVAPASGGSAREEEQAVAQLLRDGNQMLVCSYLLRTAAQY